MLQVSLTSAHRRSSWTPQVVHKSSIQLSASGRLDGVPVGSSTPFSDLASILKSPSHYLFFLAELTAASRSRLATADRDAVRLLVHAFSVSPPVLQSHLEFDCRMLCVLCDCRVESL
jgi:hypothetical protein